jgi:hypothetical protein
MFHIQGTPTLLDGSSGFRAIFLGQNMANKLHHFATSEVFMSEPTSASVRRSTQETPFDQWIPFLAGFTRENRGAHARLDIFGRDFGYQVETENRPFDGVSADQKSGERSVWIAFGSTPKDHFTHGVNGATVIRVLPATDRTGAVLEVEAQDGTRTVLELTRPEDYALPPATA